MTDKELEQLYLKLLNDDDFQEMEIQLKATNIFEILGVQNYEIRHSNFLAWLLNPTGNHGLGSTILKKFLYEITIDERCRGLSIFDINQLNFDSTKIFREKYNIDLLIHIDNYVLVIENKIFHSESKEQLEKYKNLVEDLFKEHHFIYVFLNPYGIESSQNDKYINFSYESILKYLQQLLKIDKSISLRTKIYIEDYINNFKNNIMENGDKYKLANKIYTNHKELFDFILSNRLDLYSELRNTLKEKIQKEKKNWILTSCNSSYIRFITENLKPIIASKAQTGYKEWPTGEVFLFEIHFNKSKNYINPYYTVSRAVHPQREKLLDLLTKIYDPNKDDIAWNVYQANKPFYIDENLTIDNKSAIEKFLDLIIKRLSEIIEEAEDVILPHKEELIKIK